MEQQLKQFTEWSFVPAECSPWYNGSSAASLLDTSASIGCLSFTSKDQSTVTAVPPAQLTSLLSMSNITYSFILSLLLRLALNSKATPAVRVVDWTPLIDLQMCHGSNFSFSQLHNVFPQTPSKCYHPSFFLVFQVAPCNRLRARITISSNNILSPVTGLVLISK